MAIKCSFFLRHGISHSSQNAIFYCTINPPK
nr:MAG TPA: hypothetical protein [Caudoviricetes sp.]